MICELLVSIMLATPDKTNDTTVKPRTSWCEPNYPAWGKPEVPAPMPVNENGPTAKDCQKNPKLKGCTNG